MNLDYSMQVVWMLGIKDNKTESEFCLYQALCDMLTEVARVQTLRFARTLEANNESPEDTR